MKKEKRRCPECKKIKPTNEVYVRNCGYQREINEIEYQEMICNDCEQEHLGAI